LARWIEKRLAPADSRLAIAGATVIAVVAAMLAASPLFFAVGADPVSGYRALLREAFATPRGFGFSLVRAAPLALIALGTIVSWTAGFGYLGFEGCFVLGATATTWLGLLTADGAALGPLPLTLFLPAALLLSFSVGGAWASLVGVLRARLGGNEVLISLMTNYVAILLVQYLISGPMRAPGGLPQSARLPQTTWLPFIIPDTRAHAGILIALAASGLVWALLRKTVTGYEMVVAGFNPAAARYGGVEVSRKLVLAAFLGGGLGAIAGLVELLGVQHRLVDGMSGGVGFVGVVVALLARLNPIAVLPTAVIFGGMTVGADAMQRSAGVPSSIAYILQGLIVLFVLAADLLRRYEIVYPPLSRARRGNAPP
jgi:general nucleoside transport system permease protein